MRNYARTCKDSCSFNLVYKYWYSSCHDKVQSLWCTFQTHFSMRTRYFQKIVFRMKLFLSLLSFIFYIANRGVWKYVFTSVVIKIKIFHSCHTLFVRVALASYSCHTRVALVSFVSHLCCSCSARIALVLLVSHSLRSCMALVL